LRLRRAYWSGDLRLCEATSLSLHAAVIQQEHPRGRQRSSFFGWLWFERGVLKRATPAHTYSCTNCHLVWQILVATNWPSFPCPTDFQLSELCLAVVRYLSVYLSLFYYSSAVRYHAAAQELAACRILSDWAESQRIYFGAETAQHVGHCALRLEMN